MLQKVLWSVVALGCLVMAFVVGGGSAANAVQGQAVLAGTLNFETYGTGLCNASACEASNNDGLLVRTDQANGTGVVGLSTGVSGIGVQGKGPDGFAGGTGVYGEGSYAVHGKSTTGWGVWGEGADRGVYGISDNEGVVGFGNAVGVRAESPNIALRVKGKLELSRSGSATIAGTTAAPKSSVVVSNVALSAKSMVIVTVQKNVSGVWVRAAVPNVAGSSVTIYLNKAVTNNVPVAWMVMERP